MNIDGEVIVVPHSGSGVDPADPAALDSAEDNLAPSTSTDVGELTPELGEGQTNEGNPEPTLPSADSSDEEGDEDEPSTSPPVDEEPRTDSEPLPPVDLPIATPEPDPDDSEIDPDPVDPADPVTPPVDVTPPAEPIDPPSVPNPNPISQPILEPDHCLTGWEGSSCDTCSGQTQSDLLACRVYIDCYIQNECDPLTCGSLEQVCGVNSLGNGLAPKGVADAVYGCMCAP